MISGLTVAGIQLIPVTVNESGTEESTDFITTFDVPKNAAEMPLRSYTVFHRSARLSQEEKEAIIEYLKSIRDSL